jgi:hypothetical protein
MLSARHAIQPAGVVDPRPAGNEGGLDLKLFIPRYRVSSMSKELSNGTTVVHLRRKYIKLPLFLRSFHLACYTKLLSAGINPEENFSRVKHDPDAYVKRHGVLTKNAQISVFHYKYLNYHSQTSTYHGYPVTSYFVTARFCDRSTPALDLGMTIEASSKNVRFFVQREMLRRIGDPSKFDFAKFFEDFLASINYHKAVLVMAAKYNSVHRLHALQYELNAMKSKGEFS